MPYLTPSQFSLARPLFAGLSYHLCVQAVLAGAGPGEVWVDDAASPRVSFVTGSEGTYLGGDPACRDAFAELRKVIPEHAYLYADPPAWEQALPEAWVNAAARRHARQHYLLQAEDWRPPDGGSQVPAGMRLVPVDAAFFAEESLEHHDTVMAWVGGWRSHDDFLARGAGACLVHGSTIAAMSVMDCALDERCEIGVITDARYRRRGLGSLVVAATIAACLERGYREIGWQCYANNWGSIGIARRMGFVKERDYLAFSGWIPSENPGDMPPEECEDWARHYERASAAGPLWTFEAAVAWSMAGRAEWALDCLRALKESGWKGRREWFAGWRLDAARALPEYAELEAALVEEETA